MDLGARTVAVTCSLIHSCFACSARLVGRNVGHPDVLGVGPPARALHGMNSGHDRRGTFSGHARRRPDPGTCPTRAPRWHVSTSLVGPPAEFTRWMSWLVTRAAVPDGVSVRSPWSEDPLGEHSRQRGCTVRWDTGLWFPRCHLGGGTDGSRRLRPSVVLSDRLVRGGFSGELAQCSRGVVD